MSTETRGSSQPIGWREWVGLPSLGITAIQAKIDTGAYISALHACEIEPIEVRGRCLLRFRVFPRRRDESNSLRVQAPLIGQRLVRSSSGHEELRWVVKASFSFAGAEWPIELGITARETMAFRLLLGRAALAERFVVDPGATFLGGRRRRKRAKRSPGKELE